MNGQKLRDLKRNTELLILIEILNNSSVRMKEISHKLDVTVQAVSQYISAMKKEGLLDESRGRFRPTRKGMQIVQEHFTSIKDYVDSVLRKIRVIDRCVAIAGEGIKKGQKVGLVMEDGMLMAYSQLKSSSSGKAMEAAHEGDDVLIGQLEGIVDMELGKLLVIETPSEVDGGSKKTNADRIRQRIEDLSPGLLVAGDLVGASLLSKSTEELFTIHAPVESAMSALSKGVDVVFCGTRDSVDRILEAVNALKKDTGYEIQWKSVKA